MGLCSILNKLPSLVRGKNEQHRQANSSLVVTLTHSNNIKASLTYHCGHDILRIRSGVLSAISQPLMVSVCPRCPIAEARVSGKSFSIDVRRLFVTRLNFGLRARESAAKRQIHGADVAL